MIKVYDSNEKLFSTNGIKVLHPIEAEVHKADNSDYYVDLKDTIENLSYYQKGMIVRVNTPWGMQGFRCDNPKIKNNKITCKAEHLSYDSKNYIIQDSNSVDKNCNDALEHFNSATDTESPFTTISDITTIVSTRAIRKSLFEIYEWLISADKYGGHWYRDNWTLGIKESIGQDRGVVLAYNKNIENIEVSENWDDVCTKILPYTTDGETAILLDTPYVSLTEALYDVPYTKVIKFENPLKKEDYETEEQFIIDTKTWLLGQANEYLSLNKLPKVNYSVSSKIDNISDVGDTIYVKHPKCNVDITTQVISVVYDAIRSKYTKIEFGNFKKEIKNLTQEITAQTNEYAEKIVNDNNALLKNELESATATINNMLASSYKIIEEDKIMFVDRLPKEDAVYVLKISNGGIGFSSTGINGTFTSCWTLDGTLNMGAINVINLTASLIKGGTLKLGGVNNSSGTFELYDNANNLILLEDRTGITVYATNGDYVKLNATDGFAGYDRNNNKIYFADGDTFKMKNAEVENQIKIAGKIRIVPVATASNTGVGFVAVS